MNMKEITKEQYVSILQRESNKIKGISDDLGRVHKNIPSSLKLLVFINKTYFLYCVNLIKLIF